MTRTNNAHCLWARSVQDRGAGLDEVGRGAPGEALVVVLAGLAPLPLGVGKGIAGVVWRRHGLGVVHGPAALVRPVAGVILEVVAGGPDAWGVGKEHSSQLSRDGHLRYFWGF